MNTRGLPSLNERIKELTPLTLDDFKTFDLIWRDRDLNPRGKVIDLLDKLEICIQYRRNIEVLLQKIELTIEESKNNRYYKLLTSDIDLIAKRIYRLQSEGLINADQEVKDRVKAILDDLLQYRYQTTHNTSVIPVKKNVTAPLEQPVEEYHAGDESVTEGDTQKSDPYAEQYVDTSDIDQKLRNAILVSTYDESKFEDLYDLLEAEVNEDKLAVAHKLLDAIKEAEELHIQKPFVQFAILKLGELSKELPGDQKAAIFKRVRARIDGIKDNRQANVNEIIFKQSVYQKLLGAFNPFGR